MLRRFVLAAAALTAVAGISASSAAASRNLLVGIFDEPQTLGNPDFAFAQYSALHVRAVRVNLYWGGPTGVARKKRPAAAINPADPAYDWTIYDDMVKHAAEKRIKVVFSILWTPGWANGGKPPNRAPKKMIDLRNFAFAAAKRYSGSFRTSEDPDALPLPAVRLWLAWNEPNNPVFLQPQFVRSGRGFRPESPRVYAQMCNSIWSGVHLTGLASEKVACGVTGPRGNNTARQPRPSISPLFFLQGMKRAGARFDAYAHHPYYGHRNEGPDTPPPGPRAVTLGNIEKLTNLLTQLYGNKRLWITEYGYQTRPDRLFAVSYAQQARYVSQAFAKARRNPRIDMMLWFMLKDDPRIGIGWQSGFYTFSGQRKPSWRAFQRVRK